MPDPKAGQMVPAAMHRPPGMKCHVPTSYVKGQKLAWVGQKAASGNSTLLIVATRLGCRGEPPGSL